MLTRILDKVIAVIEKALMILLSAAIAIIGVQIVFRYFFNSPLSWSEQGARCIFIWLTMLSVPCIFRRKGMICFDLITNALPRRIKDAASILVQMIVLFFALFYLYYSVELCISTGSRVMAGIAIPQNLVYIAPPIAMLLLALVMVEQFCSTLKDMRRSEER